MKISIRLFFLVSCALCAIPASHAQQGNNWYFGFNAGLSFNTNPPTPLWDGQLQTREGCASISDNNGTLLFYTDGVTVYNKQHQVMVNGTGLKGHSSSSNSAIIVPRPGSDSIYYIFTAGATEMDEGYFFTEVDISLQGGLGAVTANKNVPLYFPSTEKLTAVRHSNGIDVWVITKSLGNTRWDVYKVDCNGVNTTPVTSFAGHQPDDPQWINVNIGCLKSSPDGTKIAAANVAEDFWELLQFDASTGRISNGLLFHSSERPFGVEFSPDSKLVYIGQEDLPDPVARGGIYQYNLATYDSAAIQATKTLIGTTTAYMGSLQLGPDKKIYCAVEFLPALSVIHSPNTPGLGCNYVDREIDLVDRIPYRSLPVFFPGLITNKNADFTYTIRGDCATVDFAGTSNIPGTLNWHWDFGDGSTGTGQQVSHTYAAGGPAVDTIKLTVTSSGTCGSVIVIKNIALEQHTAVAKFGLTSSCGNLSVNFHDSSSSTGSPIQNWLWEFGDGTTSTEPSPTHVFPALGAYTVTLTVRTNAGCGVSTIQKNIVIGDKPVSDFTQTRTCAGQTVSFTDRSSTSTGFISQWYWSFGDGTVSNLQHPQKIYAAPGNYTVTLIVISSSNCASDTLIRNISVSTPPVAGFRTAGGCENQLTTLQDTSSGFGSTITRWFWSLGDGSLSTDQNPALVYPAPGTYTIKQVVETAEGCVSDTALGTVMVESKPLAAFTAANGCQGQAIDFHNTSSITFGSITSWHWDFGDGNTAGLQNPVHSYAAPGNYMVKLAARSSNGCLSDTVTGTVSIEALPQVGFTNTAACIGQPIQFTNTTTLAPGTIADYTWDFGDGSGSGLDNPIHSYTRSGDFTSTLVAITQNGCRAMAAKTFHIAPVQAFAGNDTTIALGQPLQLQASGGQQYQWSPPDFLSADNIFNPIATLVNDQTYRVRVTTPEGCIGDDEIRIRVLKGPDIYVPGGFAPDGKNRIFRPVLAGIQELYYFSVYNRWGQLMFTTKEDGKGWDGKLKGVTQPTGVFVWELKARDYLGKIIVKKGTVVLIR